MEGAVIVILLVVIVILLSKRRRPSGDAVLFNLINEVTELRKEITKLNYKVQESTSELANKMDLLQQGDKFEARQADSTNQAYEPEPVVTAEDNKPVEATREEYREEPAIEATTYLMPEEKKEPETEAASYLVHEEKEEPAIEAVSNLIQEEQGQEAIEEPARASRPQGKTPEIQEGIIDKWMRNNPDLEKFIGENLINKIGIAVLVLGIAFFVKYAIDKDWINETGRVCIGLGCGAILVGLAHFMRNSYRSFSSVLAGGGIAVFYFTIAFGFHQYHLMSQTAAFIIMVVITAFAIALSVLYDKLELAIIATVGGFITPFLLSTGEGNYKVLFTYLIILDAGILLLSYFKRWQSINIIALLFTEIIYGGWLVTVINNSAKPISYPVALLFASVFYFIFLAMNIVNQVKNKERFKPFDFIILLLISSSYFAAGIALLHSWNHGAYQGVFTLGLGMVNLVLAYLVYKKGMADKNIFFLLIGITLTFVTLTIPIQLQGHAITLFWCAEFVLLYWLSGYSGIRLFKYSSLLICMLSLVSLFMDWGHASELSSKGLHVIFNNVQGLVTNLVATAAFALWWYLLRKNKEGDIGGVPNVNLAVFAIIAATALLFTTCIFGVNLYFNPYTASYAIPNVYHRMITEIFALGFVFIAQKRKAELSGWFQFAALCVCLLALVFSISNINELRTMVLASKANWAHFYVHWADGLLLGILFYRTIQNLREMQTTYVDASKMLSILLTIMVLTFLSTELLHIYVIVGYRGNNTDLLEMQYGKAGLTVLWGLCSFALMWLGMKHQNKTLRIISLVLFSVALLKLFLIDISGISDGGKILAFILLGVLLLTMSFMYQKLKKIIIDDGKDKV